MHVDSKKITNMIFKLYHNVQLYCPKISFEYSLEDMRSTFGMLRDIYIYIYILIDW